MPVYLYHTPLCPSHVPPCEPTYVHICAACSSEVLRVKFRLLPQTRTFLLNNHQNMMVQLCGLHTTVTLFTHGPSTRSLCVQPCGHTRTRSRCLVITVLTVILWSHVVTCGHDAGHCVYIQSPCHMWSHVNTAPSHSCHISTRAYTWMGHPVTVCSLVVTRGYW